MSKALGNHNWQDKYFRRVFPSIIFLITSKELTLDRKGFWQLKS